MNQRGNQALFIIFDWEIQIEPNTIYISKWPKAHKTCLYLPSLSHRMFIRKLWMRKHKLEKMQMECHFLQAHKMAQICGREFVQGLQPDCAEVHDIYEQRKRCPTNEWLQWD